MIDPADIDIDNINNCMIENYFCDVCCDTNIGAADEVGREKCTNKCKFSLIEGDTNKFTIEYVVEVNSKKLEAER